MLIYSALLTLGLLLSSPWWLLRMATTQRYREGLRERLGAVPAHLKTSTTGKRVVWIHAVSVGEVLAASQLIAGLEAALGEGWSVVVSTTTRTGQALARERFGAERVFYFPLDFAFAVRTYLSALKPSALVLMESELWPRTLHECQRNHIPVIVVNARVSDRSFARAMKMKALWGKVLLKVSLWLVQSEDDAKRLIAMGASVDSVRVGGNLKYDIRAPKLSRVAELIKEAAAGRPIVVAGSTVGSQNPSHQTKLGTKPALLRARLQPCRNGDVSNSALAAGGNAEHPVKIFTEEEEMILTAWQDLPQRQSGLLLVLAPRHPERFDFVESILGTFHARASLLESLRDTDGFKIEYDVILLDTIGDLAAVYGLADIALVGGSLLKRGGHNPLEPAQFAVPVVMGPSYENFRDIVDTLKKSAGIFILEEPAGLSTTSAINVDSAREDSFYLTQALEAKLAELLTNRDAAKAMGERGRQVFEAKQGATKRAVEAIVAVVKP
jgi:3-deoxy-D-manno-octulosonic-acid transferase